MADLSNKCSSLISILPKVKEEYKIEDKSLDEKFNLMLDIQFNLQKVIYENLNIHPLIKEYFLENKQEISFWIINQWIAIQDEYQELYESIGGEKYKSASWKWWKRNHKDFLKENLKDVLTAEEKEELKFEVIDIVHFILNYLVLSKILSEKNIVFAKDIQKESEIKNEVPFDIQGYHILNLLKMQNITIKHYTTLIEGKVFEYFFNKADLSEVIESINENASKSLYLIYDFWTNILGLDGNDFVYYYIVKNYENIQRQKRGY